MTIAQDIKGLSPEARARCLEAVRDAKGLYLLGKDLPIDAVLRVELELLGKAPHIKQVRKNGKCVVIKPAVKVIVT